MGRRNLALTFSCLDTNVDKFSDTFVCDAAELLKSYIENDFVNIDCDKAGVMSKVLRTCGKNDKIKLYCCIEGLYDKSFDERFNELLRLYETNFFHYFSVDFFSDKENKLDALEFLITKKNQGSVKNIGISFYGKADELRNVLDTYKCIDFVRLSINYLDITEGDGKNCLRVLEEHNVTPFIVNSTKNSLLSDIDDDIMRATFKKVQPKLSQTSWAVRFAAGLNDKSVVFTDFSSLSAIREALLYMKDYTELSEREEFVLEHAVDCYRALNM